MKNKDVDDILANTLKIFQIVKKKEMEPEKEYIYECPICNGKLHASKASLNGHLHIYCEKCKFALME